MRLNSYPTVGNDDMFVNAYILAWDHHALLHDPDGIFNANYKYPTPSALCLTETMIVPAILTLPLAIFGKPLLTYNVTLIGAMIASALAWRWVLRRWGLGSFAAWVGGLLFGFSPWRFGHLIRLQLWLGWWIPLTLWSFDAWLRGGGLKRAIATGALLAAQFYSCVYLFYFMLIFIPPAGLVVIWSEWARIRARWRVMLSEALAGFAALVALLAPAYEPYMVIKKLLYRSFPMIEIMHHDASLADYLRPNEWNLFYGAWAPLGINHYDNAYWEHDLWMGWLAMAGPIMAVAAWRWGKRARAWGENAKLLGNRCLMLAVGGIVLVMVSFGPVLRVGDHFRLPIPMYRWCFDWIPGFSAMRVPTRAGGAMGSLALSGLAAVGLDTGFLLAKRRGKGWLVAFGTLVLGFACFDLLNRPLPLAYPRDLDRYQAARRALGAPHAGAELILPMDDRTALWGPLSSAPFTFPMLNGTVEQMPDPNRALVAIFNVREWTASQLKIARWLRVGRVLVDRRREGKTDQQMPVNLETILAKSGMLLEKRELPSEGFTSYEINCASSPMPQAIELSDKDLTCDFHLSDVTFSDVETKSQSFLVAKFQYNSFTPRLLADSLRPLVIHASALDAGGKVMKTWTLRQFLPHFLISGSFSFYMPVEFPAVEQAKSLNVEATAAGLKFNRSFF
jgi:hypothetical protein